MFWKDLDEEKTLRMCSMAARGLWSTHMLPIMAASGGYLAFNGTPLSLKQLASLVGCPIREVEVWFAELDENKVFSRDRFGTPYNRRRIKAEKKASAVRKNGQNGGRPKSLNNQQDFNLLTKTEPKPNQNDQPRARVFSSPISPISPEKKNDADVGASARPAWIAIGERVMDLMGVRDDPRWMGNYSLVEMWLKQGYDAEADIYPTVAAIMAKRNGHGAPTNLKYFDRAIAQAHADRIRPAPEVIANGPGHSGKPKRTQESDRATILRALNLDLAGSGMEGDERSDGPIIEGDYRRGD